MLEIIQSKAFVGDLCTLDTFTRGIVNLLRMDVPILHGLFTIGTSYKRKMEALFAFQITW